MLSNFIHGREKTKNVKMSKLCPYSMRATQRPFCASPVEPLIWKRNLEKMCVVNLEKIHKFEHLQFRRCFWQSGSLPVITIFCPPEICFRLDFKNSSGACGAFRLSVISVNHPRRSGIWDPRRSGVHPLRLRFPGRGCGGSSPRHQARCPSTSDVDVPRGVLQGNTRPLSYVFSNFYFNFWLIFGNL